MAWWDWLSVYDETGHMLQACSGGSCAAGGSVPIHGSHTYTAYLAVDAPWNSPPAAPYAVSNSVTVTNVGWIGSATLTERSDTTRHILDARASASLNGYPYWLSVYDEAGRMVQGCSIPSCLDLEVHPPAGTVKFYRAFVAQGAPQIGPPGNDVSAVSNVLVVTELPADEVLDSAQMAEMIAAFGAKFSSAGEACFALGAVLGGNPRYHSSAPDVTLECDLVGVKGALALAIALFGYQVLAALLEATYTEPAIAPPVQPAPPENPTRPDPHAPWGPSTGINLDDLIRVIAGVLSLSTIGPSTQPAPTEAQLQAAVRQCMDLVQAASPAMSQLGAADECGHSRMLVVGGMAGLGREAAEHDVAVIRAAPQLVQLEHMYDADKRASGVSRRWYARQPYWSSCADVNRRTQQCDEYPLYATVEGGPAAYAAYGPIVLSPIATADNLAEGRAYLAMVRTTKCGFARGNDQHFLVVPLPEVEVPSFFVCPGGGS